MSPSDGFEVSDNVVDSNSFPYGALGSQRTHR